MKGCISRREKPALEELITGISGDSFRESRPGSFIGKTPEKAIYHFGISRLAVHDF